MTIQLLLTELRSLAPVLAEVPGLGAGHAPRPALRLPPHLAVPGHSNDLVAEQWGVIAPATPEGEQMLEWIRPLCELRKQQCGLGPGDELRVWRVAPEMTAEQARAWRATYDRLPVSERPGYLLLLGDLHETSHELQQELMVSAAVGRLCFTDAEGRPDGAGYQAYCAKVRALEARRAEWRAGPRLLLYAAHDGSVASQEGYYDLIRECYRDARAEQYAWLASMDVRLFGRSDDHQWHAGGADPAAAEGTLLHHARRPEPAVLMSLTHGLAVSDPAEQRTRQGALVLAEAAGRRRREVLDAGCFAQTFLPGGFWFVKACFGAGTPATSVYEPWLASLSARGGYAGDPREALAYLARPPARPFVARVPQAALAHPDGPLGVLGHVDLDWTYGYQAMDGDEPGAVRPEPGPYYDVLRTVLLGYRLGAAVASLSHKALSVGAHLALLYGTAEGRGAGPAPDRADHELALRAWLWMRYHDLSGYVLLGDPACQVPTSAARDLGQPARVEPAVAGHSTEIMVDAVLAFLRQRTPPDEIARAAGVHPTTLERWVRIYQDAGRQALAALLGEES